MKNDENENGNSNEVVEEREPMLGLDRNMVCHVAEVFCNPDPQARFDEALKILSAMFGDGEGQRIMFLITEASHAKAVIRSLDADGEELL
tara:strand:- start:3152 stop:3421 length:270 start_codon:yes stop_codon:yes gene_type:complete